MLDGTTQANQVTQILYTKLLQKLERGPTSKLNGNEKLPEAEWWAARLCIQCIAKSTLTLTPHVQSTAIRMVDSPYHV